MDILQIPPLYLAGYADFNTVCLLALKKIYEFYHRQLDYVNKIRYHNGTRSLAVTYLLLRTFSLLKIGFLSRVVNHFHEGREVLHNVTLNIIEKQLLFRFYRHTDDRILPGCWKVYRKK